MVQQWEREPAELSTLAPTQTTRSRGAGERCVNIFNKLHLSKFSTQTLFRRVCTLPHSARDLQRAAQCAESSTRLSVEEFVPSLASPAAQSDTSATQRSRITTSRRSEPFFEADFALSVCKLILYRNKEILHQICCTLGMLWMSYQLECRGVFPFFYQKIF